MLRLQCSHETLYCIWSVQLDAVAEHRSDCVHHSTIALKFNCTQHQCVKMTNDLGSLRITIATILAFLIKAVTCTARNVPFGVCEKGFPHG